MVALRNKILIKTADSLAKTVPWAAELPTVGYRIGGCLAIKNPWWRVPKQWLTALIVVSLVLMLAGCGFKLRGDANLPPELAETYVKFNRAPGAAPSRLGQALSDLLIANGANVTASPEGATAVIEIIDERIRRRTLAADSRGDTRDYTFTLVVDYRVAMADGRPLVPEDSIAMARNIIYSESDVLGRQEGEAITLRELESSVAQAIVRRLETIGRSTDEATL